MLKCRKRGAPGYRWQSKRIETNMFPDVVRNQSPLLKFSVGIGGAFFLHAIWGIANRTYIALLVFVPGLILVMSFILGAKGNEWAWRNRHWYSVDDFSNT